MGSFDIPPASSTIRPPSEVGEPDQLNEHHVFGYERALDGLRGVAVLGVLAFHSGLLPGGFLGVDIFFALSGYLITTLLLRESTRNGAIAFGNFYMRRALRLLPALFTFVSVWTAVLLVTVPSAFIGMVLQFAGAVLLYVANWAAVAGVPLGIFLHSWSLAIEEQFYLAWPLAVVALNRLRRPKLVAAALALAAVASAGWRCHLNSGGASWRRIYMATDAHADGLLIGAALAFWLAGAWRAPGARSALWIGLVSTATVTGLLLAAPLRPSYEWGASALVAVATAGMIVAILARVPFVTNVLEAKWLVATGWISYGLYLWHFPIFYYSGALDVADQARGSGAQIVSAWTLSFAIAIASYWIVERPALAYKARFHVRD